MLYEFTEFHLDRVEFYNLVFMNAPRWWHDDEDQHKLLLNICGRPLRTVVKILQENYGSSGDIEPSDVFEKLQTIIAQKENGEYEEQPWFKKHLDMSNGFDFDIMPPIWIRNLSQRFRGCERKKCPDGSYYIEDGCTRALVYALSIMKNPSRLYKPFHVIHANSWELAAGVLERLPQPAKALEDTGVYPYKRKIKKSVRLPLGIGIDWYKGSSRRNKNNSHK